MLPALVARVEMYPGGPGAGVDSQGTLEYRFERSSLARDRFVGSGQLSL